MPTRKRRRENRYFDPVEARAKKLAKIILKKDFEKLFKKGYLKFKIKVRSRQLKRTYYKVMYMFKNFTLYQQMSQRKFRKVCSIVVNYSQDTRWGGAIAADEFNSQNLNHYDTMVAHYLWLKRYSKIPVSAQDFQNQFNLLEHDDSTLAEILARHSIYR